MTILHDLGYTNVVAGAVHGHVDARDQTAIVAGGPTPGPGTSGWWLARVYTSPPATAEICTAEIRRRAADPPAAVDPKPPSPGRPDVFRKIGVRVELVRSTFIRGEIYGEFDIETAAEQSLARNGQPALRNGPRNPSDGICLFLLRLRLSEDRGAWEVTAEFRAIDADLDGLAKMDQAHANQTVLDMLGALSIMAPLSASATNLSPAAGAVVALGSIAVGASDLIHTHSLILRGGELKVSDGIVGADGTTTVADSGTQLSVLLDLEIAFSFDLGIVRVDPAHPVTTRYKAIGVRSQWGTAHRPRVRAAAGLRPEPRLHTRHPRRLVERRPRRSTSILRILGFRVSRDNPTYLEVEVGLGLDLGIVTVDTVRVRGASGRRRPSTSQLTKLAATLDIPGVHPRQRLDRDHAARLQGRIRPDDRAGQHPGLGRPRGREHAGRRHGRPDRRRGRVPGPDPARQLRARHLRVHGRHRRQLRPQGATGAQVPALDWLQAQFARPGGVMDPTGWELDSGRTTRSRRACWSARSRAGSSSTSRGSCIIEVPGPRLLLVMKADVLSLPPVLNSNQSATFLAVLDIDFGRGTITIGIVAAYEIEKILKVRVPVTAFFDAQQPENWLVDLGNYHRPGDGLACST